MPRIDDIMLSSVFYIYPSKQDAKDGSEAGGSGFFYGVPSEYNPSVGYIFAVTNKHVVFGAGMHTPVLRVNTQQDGFDIIPTEQREWKAHPFGADLAISMIGLDINYHDMSFFKPDHILNDEFIKDNNVGVGDEVIVLGRFRVHAGESKNYPTAMFGNIAQMSHEPLKNPFTGFDEESIMVEMRSISGFSGSPVVLYIPPFSKRWKPGKGVLSNISYYRLLGILWGHINLWEKAKDNEGHTFKVKMNSAMAGVVPIWKFKELLEDKEIMEMIKEQDKELERQLEASPISLDMEEGEADFTQKDKGDALKKSLKPKKKNSEKTSREENS